MARTALKRGAGLAQLAALLTVVAIGGALLAALGSGGGWWGARTGMALLPLFALVGLTAFGLGLFARFRRRSGQMLAVTAILVSLGFLSFLGTEAWRVRQAAGLHDVSTDLDRPPRFRTLRVRQDSTAGVPLPARPGYSRLTPIERWKAVHSDAYPELRPVALTVPPDQAIRRAEAAARELGWRVVAASPARGELEVVATSRFFGLRDDIAVRAVAASGGSLVDVRSVAREGVSDDGRGARNIKRLTRRLTN